MRRPARWQRNSVQPLADVHHQLCIGILEGEGIQRRRGAVHKELDGPEAHRFGRRGAIAYSRQVQRRQALDVLAIGPQRLATRRKDVDAGRRSQDRFGEFGRCRRHVFAVVQQQQQRLVVEEGQDIGHCVVHAGRQTQHGGQRAGNQLSIGKRSEVDKVDTRPRRPLSLCQCGSSHRHGDGGFSNPAGAHESDQPVATDVLAQGINGGASADDAMQVGHEAGHLRCARRKARQRRLATTASQRRDEAVAAIGDGHDVPAPIATIAKGLAKRGDVYAKIALDHHGAGPDAFEDLVLGDERPRPIEQQEQDIERAAAEVDTRSALHEYALRRVQRERAEAHQFVGGVGRDFDECRAHQWPPQPPEGRTAVRRAGEGPAAAQAK
jgi:hypothetical protein